MPDWVQFVQKDGSLVLLNMATGTSVTKLEEGICRIETPKASFWKVKAHIEDIALALNAITV